MNDEESSGATSLVPVREQTVDFYGDALPAAQAADGTIWVPVRPICEHLGLDWPSQYQRIKRDTILARSQGVVIITTPGGEQPAISLPLKMLPGWLFGVQAKRVREELRDKILRYQEDCYEVLWNAFKGDVLPAQPTSTDLSHAEIAVENARALLHLAEQQLEFERRLTTMADYMRPFVKDTRRDLAVHEQRITSLELQLSAGSTISEAQATEVQLAVKAVAAVLQLQGSINGHQRVYAELYRRYGVGAYRQLPLTRYDEVMAWLHGWFDELSEKPHDPTS